MVAPAFDLPVQVQRDLWDLDADAAKTFVPLSFQDQYGPSASGLQSPSRADGATEAEELHWRKAGARLIEAAGYTIRLTQPAIGLASALYHLFFQHRSALRNDRLVVVMAALLLAGKTQEPSRPVRHIIETVWRLRYSHNPSEAELIQKNEVYGGVREGVGVAERNLLYLTGCRLEAALPYDSLMGLVEDLGLNAMYPDLYVVAWTLCNASWQTLVSLQHSPEQVAASCVVAACSIVGVAVPPRLWDLISAQQLDPAVAQELAMTLLREPVRRPELDAQDSLPDAMPS